MNLEFNVDAKWLEVLSFKENVTKKACYLTDEMLKCKGSLNRMCFFYIESSKRREYK